MGVVLSDVQRLLRETEARAQRYAAGGFPGAAARAYFQAFASAKHAGLTDRVQRFANLVLTYDPQLEQCRLHQIAFFLRVISQLQDQQSQQQAVRVTNILATRREIYAKTTSHQVANL